MQTRGLGRIAPPEDGPGQEGGGARHGVGGVIVRLSAGDSDGEDGLSWYFSHFLRMWYWSRLFLGIPLVGSIIKPQNSQEP